MTENNLVSVPRSFPLRPTVGIWLCLAAAMAVVLPAPQAPAPLRLAMILGPVVAFAIALWTSSTLNDTLDAIDPRWVVALHGSRVVIGAAFVLLANAGQLPREFGWIVGAGDMVAGAGAVLLVLAWSWVVEGGRGVLVFWNVLGVVDFLNAQRIAAFVLRGREQEFIAMNHLPMALVPYIGVPLLFASHVFLLKKYVARAGRSGR